MRLIDADEFKKQIAGMSIVINYPADKANKMCELIDCQPIAYDVDKVVEQMEEMREEMLMDTAYDNDTVNHYLGYADLMTEAVKSGCIE